MAQAASAEDPTAWAEFSNKLKEAIISTFDSNVSLYEEDVRKADSQRQLEGWQYLPFFRQKVRSSSLSSIDVDLLTLKVYSGGAGRFIRGNDSD